MASMNCGKMESSDWKAKTVCETKRLVKIVQCSNSTSESCGSEGYLEGKEHVADQVTSSDDAGKDHLSSVPAR